MPRQHVAGAEAFLQSPSVSYVLQCVCVCVCVSCTPSSTDHGSIHQAINHFPPALLEPALGSSDLAMGHTSSSSKTFRNPQKPHGAFFLRKKPAPQTAFHKKCSPLAVGQRKPSSWVGMSWKNQQGTHHVFFLLGGGLLQDPPMYRWTTGGFERAARGQHWHKHMVLFDSYPSPDLPKSDQVHLASAYPLFCSKENLQNHGNPCIGSYRGTLRNQGFLGGAKWIRACTLRGKLPKRDKLLHLGSD